MAAEELVIRLEQPGDVSAIAEVTREAFASVPHSEQKEAEILEQLRAAGALRLSLVALVDDRIVGHIALSPVTLSDGSRGWYGLGPLSVVPDAQGQGIGSMLMDEALHRLRVGGASGCVVLGDPEFYCRFGFEPDPNLQFAEVDPVYFQALHFDEPAARGEVQYHAAFYL